MKAGSRTLAIFETEEAAIKYALAHVRELERLIKFNDPNNDDVAGERPETVGQDWNDEDGEYQGPHQYTTEWEDQSGNKRWDVTWNDPPNLTEVFVEQKQVYSGPEEPRLRKPLS